MAKYTVSTKSNKSTSEFNHYYLETDRSKQFVFEVDYRSGSFLLNLSKTEYASIKKDDPNGEFRPFDYDGCVLIETYDSWSVFFRFENSTITVDEQQALEERFFEDGIDAFENLGYVFDESYYVLYGALDLNPMKTKKIEIEDESSQNDDINKLFGM